MRTFLAASFIIPKWKMPNCPSADEWINNIWYVHTMKYNSAIKNKPFLHGTTWVSLKKHYG